MARKPRQNDHNVQFLSLFFTPPLRLSAVNMPSTGNQSPTGRPLLYIGGGVTVRVPKMEHGPLPFVLLMRQKQTGPRRALQEKKQGPEGQAK